MGRHDVGPWSLLVLMLETSPLLASQERLLRFRLVFVNSVPPMQLVDK
jgi:hypothetical protein